MSNLKMNLNEDNLLTKVHQSINQFSAVWSMYASNSGFGEVVDMNGLLIANARLPWYLTNAAILSSPIASQEDLVSRVKAAISYYEPEQRPWFFVGSKQWLGEAASETMSQLGLTEAFTMVGMECEQLASPIYPLPEVETRRIVDEAGRMALSELNSIAYEISTDWVYRAVKSEELWNTPLYGYNAYIEGQTVATAFVVPLNNILYVAYVATAMAHRRKGLAELVMRRSLEHATRDTGIARTSLHATPDGYSGYLKMGYLPVDQFVVYVPK
jgi:hypothetical protein